jgi:nitroimidazol reductase NimA-like FMN-containing flavoprotein (pyridoxamine 5'-phosphate oxidase superfamily)
MDTWGTSVGGRLVHLTRQECLTLLGTRSIGRVGFCTPTGPVVLPVNYALHDGAPLFRTSSDGTLADLLHDSAAVALEVDDVDERARSGWSVLVRGHASVVEHPNLPTTTAARPRPWAGGARMLHIAIVPTEISGRRLEPAEDPSSGRSWMRS